MKNRHLVTYIIGLMILCATAGNAGADNRVSHRVSAEVRPVLNIPTHGFYRGYNDMGKAVPHAASSHLK